MPRCGPLTPTNVHSSLPVATQRDSNSQTCARPDPRTCPMTSASQPSGRTPRSEWGRSNCTGCSAAGYHDYSATPAPTLALTLSPPAPPRGSSWQNSWGRALFSPGCEPTQTEQRVPNTAGRGPCRAVFLTEPYAERMNTLCARDRSDAKLYQKRSVGVHSLRPRTFRLIRFRIAAATRSAVCARERSDTEHGTDLRLLGCRDGDRG